MSNDGKIEFNEQALKELLDVLDVSIRWNTLSSEIEIKSDTPQIAMLNQENILNDFPVFIKSFIAQSESLSDVYKGVTIDYVCQLMSLIAGKKRYNPVLEYLSNLKPWDNTDRFPEMFELLGIHESDDLSKVLLRKFFYQAYCLLFNNLDDPFPPIGILVLQGEQGTGKTSFVKKMGINSKFCKVGKMLDPHDKDTVIQTTAYWLCELGELEYTLKSDMNALKAFITCDIDEFRVPYAKAPSKVPRHTSFIGTCNGTDFLIDQTGNRKYLTVPIQKIDFKKLDAFDVNQFWKQVEREVNDLYDEVGDYPRCYDLTADEQFRLEQRNRGYLKLLKSQQEVEDIITVANADELSYKWVYVTATQFIEIYRSQLGKYSADSVGKALKKVGAESKRDRTKGTVYLLPIEKSTANNMMLKSNTDSLVN